MKILFAVLYLSILMGWIPSCIKRKFTDTPANTPKPAPAVITDTAAPPQIVAQPPKEADGRITDPVEVFKYWAGEEPWEGIEVINGTCWHSDNFLWKEYSLSLGYKMSPAEAKDFSFGTGIKRISKRPDMSQFPDWFKITKDFEIWEGSSNSYYFLNRKTGVMYMHEEQM